MVHPSEDTVHKLPKDMKIALKSLSKLQTVQDSLTSLAHNEWICWVTSVKNQETRNKHIT